jgi:hypothetical protein
MTLSSRITLCFLGALAPLMVDAVASAQQAPAGKVSGDNQRKEIGITVYNDGFGLVREVRDLGDLGQGRVALEFRDVASLIEPQTVAIKALGGGRLNVLEQNYRYDLLTPAKLLEKYVGKKVKVYRYNQHTGKEDVFDAEVLSVAEGNTVMRINGEVTYNFGGRIAFPDVPVNLIAKPTLVWMLDSGQPKQTVEVTYLSHGMNWHSDYVFVINENDTGGDLQGWVTLQNTTGASYENAKLKLVAGNVQRVQPPMGGATLDAAAAPTAPAPREFKEEGFFEYHLYTLNEPTTLLQNEQKQVTLMSAQDVHTDKRLIFFGQPYYYRGKYGQVMSNQKVGVYLDIQNNQQNHLGMALPKGVVRVYKADKSGAKQFIGEDQIDHTPRDEKVRIKMGEAFDVVGDRKQMSWTALGSCTSESEWEISLRNHKDVVEEVEDVEPIGGDWQMLSESHPHTKKDAFTFTYTVKVPARGETKIKYRVRVRWC